MRKFLQIIAWLFCDIVFVNMSIYSGYLIRFNGVIDFGAFNPYLHHLWPYITSAHLIVFAIFKLYPQPSEFSKKKILINTVYASTVAAMASMSIVYAMRLIHGFMPSSVFVFACGFNVILIGGWRAYVRYES